MKKTVFLIFSLFILSELGFSQINTEIFSQKGEVFVKHPDLSVKDKALVPQITMPSFNVNVLIEEDLKNKDKDIPFRFGKKFDVNLSIKDGNWLFSDNKEFWALKITSKNAFSMNLVLSGLYLPAGTELYIYDEEGTMVYGPLTSKQNFENGTFLAEIIKGETIVIRILSSEKDYKNVKFDIKKVVHGYRNLFPDNSKKASGTCNKNIECYPDWRTQGYGVTLILIDAELVGTGCLLNNTSNLPIPYVLTAFHCIDRGVDWSLSQAEKDAVYDWAFRFNFKAAYCQGALVSNYVTYNHATFRAAWSTTDFGLVQINDYSVLNTYYLSFLGWDRTGNTPTKGVGIHHPEGDVMKICIDSSALSETSWNSNSGAYYWKMVLDNGAHEDYSSGSPYLDQNKRVIGQHTGGNSECEGGDMRDWGGCFYRSWTGDSTDLTRLSNWLDPDGLGYTYTNTLIFNGISGPTLLCESGGTYSVENLPDVTYSWTTSSNIEIDGSSTGYSVNILPSTYEGGEASIWAHMYFTELGETRTVLKYINSVIAQHNIMGPNTLKLDSQDNWTVGGTQSCNSLTHEWYIEGYEDPFYTGGNTFVYTFHDEEWSPQYIEIYCKVTDGTYYAYSPIFPVQLIAHDPLSATITGEEDVCIDAWGSWGGWTASGGDGEYTFEWHINNEYIDMGDPHFPYLYYYFDSGEWLAHSNYTIDLRVYDDSTYFDASTFYFDLNWCDKMRDSIQVDPNPASDFINVSIIESKNPTFDASEAKNKSLKKKSVLTENEMITYSLFDNLGRQIYQKKIKEKSLRIPVSNLKSGVYYLKVFSSKGVADKKILITH